MDLVNKPEKKGFCPIKKILKEYTLTNDKSRRWNFHQNYMRVIWIIISNVQQYR
jgi:hypothetical protein